MFQAQSMANLNYPNPCCQVPWANQFGYDQQHHGSNLSLNMPPGYMVNPGWMGPWHGAPTAPMYPYPVPMANMHPGIQPYNHSRPASPTQSIKSRKSTLSRKSRKKYKEIEDTDDEDMDLDDRRSNFSHMDRSERISSRGRFAIKDKPSRETNSMSRELLRRSIDRRDSVPRSKQSIHTPSSDTDDEDSTSSNRNHLKVDSINEENGSEYDNVNTVENTKSFDEKWECEHCTFVNEAGTRVCQVCCKTSNANTVKKEGNFKDQTQNKNKLELKDHVQANISSDDFSRDFSETESLLNKLGKLKTSSDQENKSQLDVKKGRASRKISFWPGTKFTSFQKATK